MLRPRGSILSRGYSGWVESSARDLKVNQDLIGVNGEFAGMLWLNMYRKRLVCLLIYAAHIERFRTIMTGCLQREGYSRGRPT
jgi:hypothetical protein